ncbi:HD-GYP domain-containing protein [Hahella sp. HN01]|uniref:HD-GYP domain-containing protein n=1 Tax=Hahella sp. HN01 TaxID=2847262 RepID=UPI0020A6D95E|nr:HD-GYP domain-containing protein [Hahella sp. HN01]
MFVASEYQPDSLDILNHQGSVQQKLEYLLENLQQTYPYICRIAIAIYDALQDQLKTFASAGSSHPLLEHYQTALHEVSSLQHMKDNRFIRVINDIGDELGGGESPTQHTEALLKAGFHASYTFPMRYNERFLGFVFFNGAEKDCFQGRALVDMDMIGHMITLIVYNERSNIRTLIATVKSAMLLTHSRDPETGGHLERMARYSRLIAARLAPKHGFSDEYVEHICLFAPLHDLGKIKVPDSILLKPGRLEEEELDEMRRHPMYGHELVDALINNYGLNGVSHVNMLRNIVLYHHETLDGGGYPEHLRGEDIPIESRIVSVADVFDALTSARPYKPAWDNDKAFAELKRLAGNKLDRGCVVALMDCRKQIEEIQQRFRENEYG